MSLGTPINGSLFWNTVLLFLAASSSMTFPIAVGDPLNWAILSPQRPETKKPILSSVGIFFALDTFNGFQHGLELEWLHQTCVGPIPKRNRQQARVSTGHHYHRHLRMSHLNGIQQRKAVHAWHLNVADDQVRCAVGHLPQGVHTADCRFQMVPVPSQEIGQQLQQCGVVIYY